VNEVEPIATYRETRFEGKRVFELFPDRVRVRGSVQLSSDFDVSIPLTALNPNPMRIRTRNKAFWSGLWMLLLAVVLDTVLVSSFHIPSESFSVGLIGCIGMGGFVLMLATARKVEFVSFANVTGVQVLGFARSGPDARDFDSFVERIRINISNATKKA
jgi:hypothetical protein